MIGALPRDRHVPKRAPGAKLVATQRGPTPRSQIEYICIIYIAVNKLSFVYLVSFAFSTSNLKLVTY